MPQRNRGDDRIYTAATLQYGHSNGSAGQNLRQFEEMISSTRDQQDKHPMNRLTCAVMSMTSLLLVSGSVMSADAATSANVQQTPLTVSGPVNQLGGTLAVPQGSVKTTAAAIIIPGSGYVDKDGNSPRMIAGSPYEHLGVQLAAAGIANVRVDKRGLFTSKDGVDDPNKVTLDDYAADAAAWLSGVKSVTKMRCVWIIGHSEGSLVAEQTALSHPDSVCGLVLLGAPGHSMNILLKQQIDKNPANAPIRDAADAAIDELASGHDVDVTKLPPPLPSLFAKDKQGLLKSEFAMDPAKALAKITVPVLVVVGGKDIQVPPAEADALRAANPKIQVVVIPEMNHVLKPVATDSLLDAMKSYADPNVTTVPELAKEIVGFMHAHGA
jgi:uncharacterized protein